MIHLGDLSTRLVPEAPLYIATKVILFTSSTKFVKVLFYAFTSPFTLSNSFYNVEEV
jgi:hypothetical protein